MNDALSPNIVAIQAVPKKGDENWTPIRIVDPAGKVHRGIYDSYYGTHVYWRRAGGGWWTAEIGIYLVRPHRSTMRHEYVDYHRDMGKVAEVPCPECPKSRSPKGQRP